MRASVFAGLTATAVALTGCAVGPGGYPGLADVRAGDPPVIRVEPTNATETSPRELKVPAGTEVVWLNTTSELIWVRFGGPVAEACGEPVRFHRTYDGASFATPHLPPFADARLCFARPGRYDFIVSAEGRGGRTAPSAGGPDGNGSSPVRYGTVLVE
jgi:hypothetical protein